ncbi:MAG: hypothetical protein Q8M40_13115 [Legionella sp.]|nr:hypothetical protein [Legionella sp.]
MLYFWEKPKNCTNNLIAVYRRDISPDRFLFLDGITVEKEKIDQKAIFKHSMSKDKIISYDCIPNNSESPLVNQRIVELLLEHAPDDVQFIDAEVHCKDGVLTNYKLLNVTSTFTGIDHEKSIYTKFQDTDHILRFRRLVYKPGCMGIHMLARDNEYKVHLLIAEEIKQLFEKEKFKGIWFVTPEELFALIYS